MRDDEEYCEGRGQAAEEVLLSRRSFLKLGTGLAGSVGLILFSVAGCGGGTSGGEDQDGGGNGEQDDGGDEEQQNGDEYEED